MAVNKRPSLPLVPYICETKEAACAMVMLPPEERDPPITAIVSRACDTVAITLPVMTPCITRNLVFRILSPQNGGVEGSGTGPCGGWEQAQGPTFSQ